MAGAGGAQWPAHQQCVLDLIMWLVVKARVASLTAAGRRSDPILLGPWRVSNWWETFSSVWSCGLRLAAAVGADGGSCTFMCLGLDKTAVWAVSGFWPPLIHSFITHAWIQVAPSSCTTNITSQCQSIVSLPQWQNNSRSGAQQGQSMETAGHSTQARLPVPSCKVTVAVAVTVYAGSSHFSWPHLANPSDCPPAPGSASSPGW